MTGALALVGALLAAQIQTHPSGLKTVGLSHGRGKVRTVQILDKLYEQAGKPSLDLDFARFKDLHDNATGATSLVTFSRSAASSPGTYVAADGLIKEAAVNEVLYSEQFDNASWSKASGSTVLANQAIAPDGKQTADLISVPASNPGVYRTITVQNGKTYTWSVYVKGTPGEIINVGVNSGVTPSYQQVILTSEWQRVSGSITTVSTGLAFHFRSDFPVPAGQVGAFDVYIWGAQVEEGSTATPYIRTTSQALAAPRFDHDPVTKESLGLLVEEARSNLVTYSEEFDNPYWNAASGISVFANEVVAPDGKQTADRIVVTGVNPHLATLFSSALPAGYRRSIWAKVPSGTATVHLMGQYVDSNTLFTLTDKWQRFDVESNVGASPSYFYAVDFRGSSTATEVHLWGAQLEAGAFPTSYIPTAGTSLSRAADVATVEGTDFSSWYNASEGTVYAQYRSPTVATRGIVSLDDNTANEAIALQSFYSTGTQLVVTDGGTQQVNTAASIITDGAAYTGVAGYKAGDFAIATAGDVAIDVAGTIPTVDRMRIGVNQGGDYLNGHIARLAYWPVRKTNDVLDLISDPVANDSYQILVKTDNSGTSTSTQFTIPAAAGTYSVDWGDGTTSTGLTGAQTHTYPAAGRYVIRIDGITHYQTNDGGDKLKLLDVQNWGDEAWTSMAYSYYGASNMIMSATDAPDLSGVTSMRATFQSATSFNQPIGDWDLSSVFDARNMFQGATAFNQSIGDWDVSSVIEMQNMFYQATSFNQPIGDWDVSNVSNMFFMFVEATSFNQPIGSWDVSSVTNMGFMFYRASSFDQPLNSWDVSNVSNMSGMLREATAFNRPIGSWNVGNVTNYTNFMFGKTNANYDAANLDAIYNGWITNELSPSESIHFGTIKYTAAGAEGKDLLERADATVAVSNAVDNGSGLVRLTTAAHGLTTGNNYKVYIKDIVGTTEANGLHTVTVVDFTTIDLQGTTFTNTYTSGGTVRTGYGWTITDGGI
jgi:surface protein